MGKSKVVYKNQTLIDISGDTVEADKMLKGITAHDSNGDPVTGTLEKQQKTATITSNGTTTVTPDSGKLMEKVTITTNIQNADTVDGFHVAIRSDGSAPPSGTTNTLSFVYKS